MNVMFSDDEENDVEMNEEERVEEENKPKLEFCPDCNNLLYPNYEGRRGEDGEGSTNLQMVCKHCDHKQDAKNNCVYHNQLETIKSDALKKVKHDVIFDPTLARIERTKVESACVECGGREFVFFQQRVDPGAKRREKLRWREDEYLGAKRMSGINK